MLEKGLKTLEDAENVEELDEEFLQMAFTNRKEELSVGITAVNVYAITFIDDGCSYRGYVFVRRRGNSLNGLFYEQILRIKQC